MLTPFSFPDAQVYLRELNGSDDAVVVLRRAVIAFDDSYDKLVPLEKVTDKEAVKDSIYSLA